jgi:hypothetical protein
MILTPIAQPERSTNMSSPSIFDPGLAERLHKPAAWLLALALVVGGCSSQSPGPSAASSSLIVPTTCGDFGALASQDRDKAFPDSTSYVQYTDQGVNVAKAQEIYAEVCPSKDRAVPLSGIAGEWQQKFVPSCERFLSEPADVRVKWLFWIPVVGLDDGTKSRATAADWVQVCTENRARLLPDVIAALSAIVKARDAQAAASASAEAAAAAEAMAATKKTGTLFIRTIDNYTMRIDYSFSRPIVTSSTTVDDKPGEASLEIRQGAYTITFTNTTPSRNNPRVFLPSMDFVSPMNDPMCVDAGRNYPNGNSWKYPGAIWQPSKRCVATLGFADTDLAQWPTKLAPNESITVNGGGAASEAVMTFATTETLALQEVTFSTGVAELEVFFRFGDIDWTQAQGCYVLVADAGIEMNIAIPAGSKLCTVFSGKPIRK